MLFTCEGPLCVGISAFWALVAPGVGQDGLRGVGQDGSRVSRMVVCDAPLVDVVTWEVSWPNYKPFGRSRSSSESFKGFLLVLHFWLKISLVRTVGRGPWVVPSSSADVTASAWRFWSGCVGAVLDELLEKLLEGSAEEMLLKISQNEVQAMGFRTVSQQKLFRKSIVIIVCQS